jgi:putative SOS response-associated peptidase YedK
MLRALGLLDFPEIVIPRYNIAPTQDLLIVRRNEKRELEACVAHWGLRPEFPPDMAGKLGLYNARAESADTKPAFRNAFRRRRCLIFADGFYEWAKAGKKRLPHHFTLRDGEIYALAGLWEPPNKDCPKISCTVLTTDANSLVAPLHDRMPVILDRKDYELWLDPTVEDAAALKRLLIPFPAERMVEREVSTWVNNSRNEGPECMEPPKKENTLF